MDSIRQKLQIWLILVLIIVSLVGSISLILLQINGWLTVVVGAQIISSLATSLVVILTLGLRLIDDTLDRYENFAKQQVISLKTDISSLKSIVSNCHSTNLKVFSQDLTKASSNLIKHGDYLVTKLYPEKSLNKIQIVSGNIDTFANNLLEFKSYWGLEKFDTFLEIIILDESFEGLIQSGINYDQAKELVIKVKKEKAELIGHVKKFREEIIHEIDKIIKELEDFIGAN